MSKFEFIVVLLSIIFGLGLTNLLSGMLQAFLKSELSDTRVAWSTLHYLMAVSRYTCKFMSEYAEELQRRFVLLSVMATAVMDVGEKAVLGTLFEPWYYLFIILYIVVLAVLPLLLPSARMMRVCGWTLAAGVLSWSVVVRSVLVS